MDEDKIDQTTFKILYPDSEDYSELLQSCEEIEKVVTEVDKINNESDDYVCYTQT